MARRRPGKTISLSKQARSTAKQNISVFWLSNHPQWGVRSKGGQTHKQKRQEERESRWSSMPGESPLAAEKVRTYQVASGLRVSTCCAQAGSGEDDMEGGETQVFLDKIFCPKIALSLRNTRVFSVPDLKGAEKEGVAQFRAIWIRL